MFFSFREMRDDIDPARFFDICAWLVIVVVHYISARLLVAIDDSSKLQANWIFLCPIAVLIISFDGPGINWLASEIKNRLEATTWILYSEGMPKHAMKSYEMIDRQSI